MLYLEWRRLRNKVVPSQLLWEGWNVSGETIYLVSHWSIISMWIIVPCANSHMCICCMLSNLCMQHVLHVTYSCFIFSFSKSTKYSCDTGSWYICNLDMVKNISNIFICWTLFSAHVVNFISYARTYCRNTIRGLIICLCIVLIVSMLGESVLVLKQVQLFTLDNWRAQLLN